MEPDEIYTDADFADPELQCNLVMKGGVTSGVIYPLAICELATSYRFRCVGGSSAGAIAAAAAAAAEVGRTVLSAAPDRQRVHANVISHESPVPLGFTGLAQFPELLSRPQKDRRPLLFHLFNPQPPMRRLHRLLTAGGEWTAALPTFPSLIQKAAIAARLAVTVAGLAPGRCAVGAFLGIALTALATTQLVTGASGLTAITLVLVAVLGIALAVVGYAIGAASAVWSDFRNLPDNDFGISAGCGGSRQDVGLTPWLYRRFQELAGKPTDQPLTFGDLREHDVTLQMMTTNLSRAEPIVMPWAEQVYFFDPHKFDRLFGSTVVHHMLDHPPQLPDQPTYRWRLEVVREAARAQGLRPLPGSDDLPIIVATRMSLSFPVLLTAIPLYAVDWSRPAQREYLDGIQTVRRERPDIPPHEAAARLGHLPMEINWFSDGGLTSNLPIHFFDAPLPDTITFGLDLRRFEPEQYRSAQEDQNLTLQRRFDQTPYRRSDQWSGTAISQMRSFGASLINTARNWVDESTMMMPGYRERTVTILLDEGEGGLNLSMPPATMHALAARGRAAGAKLRDYFQPSSEGAQSLQWIQFRTATSAVTEWLLRFNQVYGRNRKQYEALLEDPSRQPSYPLDSNRAKAVSQRLAALQDVIQTMQQDPPDAFSHHRPEKAPILRQMPKVDVDT